MAVLEENPVGLSEEEIPADKKSENKLGFIPAAGKRLSFIENDLNVNVSKIKSNVLKGFNLKSNIENLIGSIEVPLGLAGPVTFDFENGKEDVFMPIATTEGALVASICRGARALNASGGVVSTVTRKVMHRAPLFKCSSISEAKRVFSWFEKNFSHVQEKVKEYSNHITLNHMKAKYENRSLSIKFEYDTGDASGQNMSTVCTWNMCKWALTEIEKELGISEIGFLIDSGWSSDKKTSSASTVEGRGLEVFAETVISKEDLRKCLKVDVKDYINNLNVCRSHVSMMGTTGFQINVANIIAGVFTATGQDIACVHESSIGNLCYEETKQGDLYISMHLPNLIIGTVGGGTSLPGQREMLEMMGCYGSGKVERFAKIIAGYCLALDLSTSTAIQNGTFALAHDRLGRNRTMNWLKVGELNSRFFNKNFEFEGKVTDVQRDRGFSTGHSLVSELVSPITKRVAGIYKFQVTTENEKPKDVVLKVKPLDKEVNQAFMLLAGLKDLDLKKSLEEYEPYSLFNNCHLKEQEMCELFSDKFKGVFPKKYGTVSNRKREIFMTTSEYLKDHRFFNARNDSYERNRVFIENVISTISPFHAENYNKDASSVASINNDFDFKQVARLSSTWTTLLNFAYDNFKDVVSQAMYVKHLEAIESLKYYEDKEVNSFKTIIHADFNTRNIGYNETAGDVKVIDWELATIGNPQRDIVELLTYTTDLSLTASELKRVVEFHQNEFEKSTSTKICRTKWISAYKNSLEEFIVHRLALYFIAHAHKECEFLKDVYAQAHHLRDLLEEL